MKANLFMNSSMKTLLSTTAICIALSPIAGAVSPPPGGGYPGRNTAAGENALFSLTTGINNTAVGTDALRSVTTGKGNTANGSFALTRNTADNNTATGVFALNGNTTGDNNTATGATALKANTTGTQNTANGVGALLSNTTGSFNTADGLSALRRNTTGNSNTAEGTNALFNNTTGSSNIALGDRAGSRLTTGSNNIHIGNVGKAGQAGQIHIGTRGLQKSTFIAGIHGATVPAGVGVTIDATGRLGTITSSARFKDEIKPMGTASESIFALKPVTFRYEHALDSKGVPQFGLVAEQVAKVNPDLVVRDDQGKVYTVRYEAVNAMLLNEFLKQYRRVEKQEAIIAQQQKQINALFVSLEEQASQIRKVSDQLNVSKRAAQLLVNN